jgi:16S rRNA (guanine1207-N2)-methyltransferase
VASKRTHGASGRDDAIVTLEEALAEVAPAATVLWGARLGSLARKTARTSSVRWITSEVVAGSGDVVHETTLSPAAGPETRLVAMAPRSREELMWLLAWASHAVPDGGEVWMAGHGREGIKSCVAALESHIGPVTTVRTKRHCRVLVARRSGEPTEAPRVEAHERRFSWAPEGGPALELATFPGTFAHGRVDHGARFMLGALEGVSDPQRVLDLGAGAGILGGALANWHPKARVDLVDASAAAVASAQRMVTLNGFGEARVQVHLSTAEEAPPGAYDLVVTNPPFHEGRHQNRTLIDGFADCARDRLSRSGTVLLVANRHLGYADALRSRFASVDVAREDSRFRVWRATGIL